MGKAEQTRQYIIEKSAPLFNRHGYAGTSMSELTEALGMTKGAIYGNFENKDEIALEALEYNFGRINDRITAILSAHQHSCDKLAAFAQFYADTYDRIAKDGGCPLLNGAIDADDGHPALRRIVNEKIEFWKGSLEKLVSRGIQRGEINASTDAREFATLFIALIEGGIMLSKITGSRAHIEQTVRHIIAMVDTSLRK